MIDKDHKPLIEAIANILGWEIEYDEHFGNIRAFIIDDVFICYIGQDFAGQKISHIRFSVEPNNTYMQHIYRTAANMAERDSYRQQLRSKFGFTAEVYAKKIQKLYDALKDKKESILQSYNAEQQRKQNDCDSVLKMNAYLGKHNTTPRELDSWYLKGSSKVEVSYGSATLTLKNLTVDQAIKIIEQLELKE